MRKRLLQHKIRVDFTLVRRDISHYLRESSLCVSPAELKTACWVKSFLYFGAATLDSPSARELSVHTLLGSVSPACCWRSTLVDSSSLSTTPICQGGRRRRGRRWKRRRKDAPSSSGSTGLWRRLPFHSLLGFSPDHHHHHHHTFNTSTSNCQIACYCMGLSSIEWYSMICLSTSYVSSSLLFLFPLPISPHLITKTTVFLP